MSGYLRTEYPSKTGKRKFMSSTEQKQSNTEVQHGVTETTSRSNADVGFQQRNSSKRTLRPRNVFGTQLSWMVVSAATFVVMGIAIPELIFISWFIGLQITCFLFTPATETPRWWTLISWVRRIGFILLLYIVFTDIQMLL